MKILIDIPNEVYGRAKRNEYIMGDNTILRMIVGNGIPIDDIKVKADMENMERAYQRGRLDATIDKYWKDVAKDIGVRE